MFYINSKDEAKQLLNNIIKVYKYIKNLLSIIKITYVYLILKIMLYHKMNSHCH